MIDRRVLQFLHVVEHGSVSKAAKASFVSAQALQQQMNALEAEVGHALFRKSPRGVELTAAGEVFRDGARRLVEVEAQTLRHVEMVDVAGNRRLRVGAQSYPQAEMLLSATAEFRRRYPWARVEVVPLTGEREFDRYIDWLKRGDIDVMQSIVALKGNEDPGLLVTRVNRVEICCVLPPDSVLRHRELLQLEDLADITVMIHRISVVSTMAQTLFDAGLKVQIIEDGGENPASILNEVNEVVAGKVLVVPEPYSRHFLDLPHVPLAVEAFFESLLCRAEPDQLVSLLIACAVHAT